MILAIDPVNHTRISIKMRSSESVDLEIETLVFVILTTVVGSSSYPRPPLNFVN